MPGDVHVGAAHDGDRVTVGAAKVGPRNVITNTSRGFGTWETESADRDHHVVLLLRATGIGAGDQAEFRLGLQDQDANLVLDPTSAENIIHEHSRSGLVAGSTATSGAVTIRVPAGWSWQVADHSSGVSSTDLRAISHSL